MKLSLADVHKSERKRFANWIRSNFRKEQTMQILFFDIVGVYNIQNNHVWNPGLAEANKSDGIKMKRKLTQKIILWFEGYQYH